MGTSIEVYDSTTGSNVPVLGTPGPQTFPQVNASQPTPRSAGDVWVAPSDTLQTFDTTWQYPTLISGWVAYDTAFWGTPRYRKTASGMVYLEGLIKNGNINWTCFTLPVGYRPTGKVLILSVMQDANSQAWMMAYPNGNLIPWDGSTAWFSITSCFYAGA